MPEPFFPTLLDPSDDEAIRVGERSLTVAELAASTTVLAARLAGQERVAVLTHARAETIVVVVAAMAAGVCAVPINPRSGTRELQHVLNDSQPDLVLTASGEPLPDGLDDLTIVTVDGDELLASPTGSSFADGWSRVDDEAPALVMYTSGTTGPPKGAVLPRRALAHDLDALAEAWEWTTADTLVHALPLYHVHGLVLGVLGPLRVGGRLHHTAPFDPATIAAALRDGGTMLFGVPTMYSRLADAATDDEGIAAALASARLLVSGSAGLPLTVHERIATLTGQQIVERYGMTETCITCAVPARAPRPGTVGPPLPGVELRLLDDDGVDVPRVSDDADASTDRMGEIAVRGPTVFLGYLNRPDATAELIPDGWVRTGDMATRDADGYLRIVGRRSVDIIKCGGFKIGAGEIESALLEHDAVEQVAVKGLPDDDLGQRIAAWVVLRAGATATAEQLAAHVGEHLSRHKRPHDVFFVPDLPRNPLGKVQKQALYPA